MCTHCGNRRLQGQHVHARQNGLLDGREVELGDEGDSAPQGLLPAGAGPPSSNAAQHHGHQVRMHDRRGGLRRSQAKGSRDREGD